MEKKKTPQGAKAKNNNVSRELCALALVFAGAIHFASLISYSHGDPSIWSQTKKIPLNYAGRIGANLAEISLQLLGAAAFLLPAMLILISVELAKKKQPKTVAKGVFWQTTALLSAATLLSLWFGRISYGGARLFPGGWLGQKTAELASHYLNPLGSILLVITAILMAVVFSTPLSIPRLTRAIGALLRLSWSQSRAAARLTAQSLARLCNHLKARRLLREQLPSKIKNELVIENEILLPKPARPISPARERPAALSLLDDSTASAAPAQPLAKKAAREKTASKFSGKYELPPLAFLNAPPERDSVLDRGRLVENSKILEQKLTDFGIEGGVVAVRPGPVITMYEFKPGPGVKISQIAALADDLSLALSAQSVRIVAPIPGKSVVGIEIPNDEREKVFLREILSTEEFQGSTLSIPLAVGKDISGAPVTTDLARMPHLLIAGAPGAGKSVFINSVICSLLYKFTPHDLRLVMVDPKQLELNLYDNIPHLLLPVVDDPKKASTALKWAVNEMERRYKIMAKLGVRNLAGFNEKLQAEGMEKVSQTLCPVQEDGLPQAGSLSHLLEHDEAGKPKVEHMPYILVIIDEFADLMMVAPKDIETSVARLAQKARAAGIHLLIATQRPSVDVITGLIKANLPSRISFQVASKMDSRTILDSIGSEKLLGQGDMLFIPPGLSRLTRIHGAFVKEDEIAKICDHWRAQGAPVFKEEILLEPEEASEEEVAGAGDALYQEAITIVRESGQASASMLQRRLKVGYNRAARMIEAMETQGIVGPADGARPREVLY